MEVQIRPIREREIPLLEEFLYEAIWQPVAGERLPREVVHSPALRPYVEAFGKREGDCCLVGEIGGRVVGAVWCRCLHGYGWIDESTPELAVALRPEWRGRGIGTQLLRAMLEGLRRRCCGITLRSAGQSGRKALSEARIPSGRGARRGVDHAL